MTKPTDDFEQMIHEAFVAGQLEKAAQITLEAYGDEILSFLASRLRQRADADEAFSMFVENVWTGLPKFAWRCSMRTWAYAIARNAATRCAAAPQRRPAHNLRLTCPELLAEQFEQVRSTTRVYQQTAVKDRFRALREQLAADDQILLVLRVDRGLAWRDLAIAISGDTELDGDALRRETARLRKAFERLKEELKGIAEREGLLAVED